MPARTATRASTNGHKPVSQASAIHVAIRTVIRNLLSVDDSMLDLPLRQLKVCVSLYQQSRSMSEIGRELGFSPSAVSQVADRLERRGLIERDLSDEDRRVRKLRLSSKGLRLIRSREQKQLQRITAAVNALTANELGQVIAGLEILAHSCNSTESS